MEIAGPLLGLLIGVSLGMLGGGGSILTVPVFVYVMGFSAKDAIAMSLAVVGATSLFGAVGHWRAGNVRLRVALVFGGVAMVGTYLGARRRSSSARRRSSSSSGSSCSWPPCSCSAGAGRPRGGQWWRGGKRNPRRCRWG